MLFFSAEDWKHFAIVVFSSIQGLQSEEVFKLYQAKYVSIVPLFEETKDSKNTAVNLEVNKSSYSFRMLEEALHIPAIPVHPFR